MQAVLLWADIHPGRCGRVSSSSLLPMPQGCAAVFLHVQNTEDSVLARLPTCLCLSLLYVYVVYCGTSGDLWASTQKAPEKKLLLLLLVLLLLGRFRNPSRLAVDSHDDKLWSRAPLHTTVL